MEQLVVVLTAVASAVVIIGVFARRAASPRELDEWARAHSIELTDGNRAMAAYWVRLLIILRVVGGTAGLLLAPLFDAATGATTGDGLGWLVWVILGWVGGSLWAETCLPRPGGRAMAASLTPRRLADYLPRYLRAAPWVAAAVVVALSVVAALVPSSQGPVPQSLPSDRLMALVALGAIALAVGAGVSARIVVGRRQPLADPEVVAVDDAVRATVLHHLAGGVTAALLLVGVDLIVDILQVRSLPYGFGGWAAFDLFFGAFVVWRWSAHRAWRVRRPPSDRPRPVPAP